MLLPKVELDPTTRTSILSGFTLLALFHTIRTSFEQCHYTRCHLGGGSTDQGTWLGFAPCLNAPTWSLQSPVPPVHSPSEPAPWLVPLPHRKKGRVLPASSTCIASQMTMVVAAGSAASPSMALPPTGGFVRPPQQPHTPAPLRS